MTATGARIWRFIETAFGICNAHLPAVAPKAPFRAEIEARVIKEAEAKAKADADAKASAVKKDPL